MHEQDFINVKQLSFRKSSIEGAWTLVEYGDHRVLVQMTTRLEPYIIRCENLEEMNTLFSEFNSALDSIKVEK
jgi:hypothetical protein